MLTKLALAVACVALLATSFVAADDDEIVVGIDLGTTYSCVAIYKEGKAEVISNSQGNRITPSVVAFTDSERLVGEAAKNQQNANPSNTVYDAKRLVGRTWSQKRVQEDIKAFPFKTIEKEGRPAVKVSYKGGNKVLLPEEISAMVLGEMKKIAEEFTGKTVKRAVVTVPAYFNDDQRQATKTAGKIAGLDVERIINEPTAASIAYGLNGETNDMNILVFDLGGGTFDVSLLGISEGVFEVLATSGNTHLGGEDFNDVLQAHFVKRIKQKTGVDVSNRKRYMTKLRNEVEKAKRALSTAHEVQLMLDPVEGHDVTEKLSRAKFNDICGDLFKKVIDPVDRVLKDSGMSKTDVDEVVLVGGSTRIPKVQELLTNFFDGKKLNQKVNPDEAVCIGAAVQAHSLAGGSVTLSGDSSGTELLLIDVTPLSMGLELQGGVMDVVIERNSPIPVSKTKEYTTVSDNQSQIKFPVFQGERKVAKHNHFLGSFTLNKIPPAPRSTPKIDVTFTIDANGILQVTAVDRGTKRKKAITISGNKHKMSDDEVEKMMREAEKFAEDDKKVVEKQAAKNELEQMIANIKTALYGDLKTQLDDDEKSELKEALKAATDFSETAGGKTTAEDFSAAKKELEDVWNPIVTKFYGGSGGGGGGGVYCWRGFTLERT
eukprot:GFYU01005062.1.p1 GENE.GFYU01005062.1~~GFYU01005062.1.p1  ORF type:complete len:659 (-),score=281.93 GFYU01005062.1:326-2302(-)